MRERGGLPRVPDNINTGIQSIRLPEMDRGEREDSGIINLTRVVTLHSAQAWQRLSASERERRGRGGGEGREAARTSRVAACRGSGGGWGEG